MLLFVYGTLKKNHQAHYHLYKSKFLGTVVTANKLLLLKDKNTHYPYLLDIPIDNVAGELYEVSQSTLESIDSYEDHPNFFKRQLIPLSDDRQAWCYFYQELIQIQDF